MKKTFITLLALGSIVMGETITLDSTYVSGTVVVNLNATTLKDIAGNGFGGANDAITLLRFDGVWQNNEVAYLGIANNGSSTSHNTSFYGSWKKAGTANAAQSISGISNQNIFTSSTDWDDIESIAIAYSFDSSSSITGTNIYATVAYRTKDNDIMSYSGSLINQMKFSNEPYKLAANALTLDTTYVLPGYTYSNEASTAAQVDALCRAAVSSSQPVVPEPATGALSLLALAGLCARRRRK